MTSDPSKVQTQPKNHIVTAAGIGAVASIIVTNTLTQVCGHPVDLHGLDWYAIGFSTFMAVVAHFKK